MPKTSRLYVIVLSVLLIPVAPPTECAAPERCPPMTKERLASGTVPFLDCYKAIARELDDVGVLLDRTEKVASAETVSQVDAILGLSFLALHAARTEIRRASDRLYDISTDPDVEENANILYERVIVLEEREADLDTRLYDVAALSMEISGGQRQRVVIARALLEDPDLVVADEPSSQVISKFRGRVGRLVDGLHADGDVPAILGSEEEAQIYRSLTAAYLPGETGAAPGSGASATGMLEGEPVSENLKGKIIAANRPPGASCEILMETTTTDGEETRFTLRQDGAGAMHVLMEGSYEGVFLGDDMYYRSGPDTPFVKMPTGGARGSGKDSPRGPFDRGEFGPAKIVEGIEQDEDVRYRGLETCASPRGGSCHAIVFLEDGRVNVAHYREEDYLLDSLIGGDEDGDHRMYVEYTTVVVTAPEGAVEFSGGPSPD